MLYEVITPRHDSRQIEDGAEYFDPFHILCNEQGQYQRDTQAEWNIEDCKLQCNPQRFIELRVICEHLGIVTKPDELRLRGDRPIEEAHD